MAEMITLPWLLLGLFIFLAFTTEAATGFGSIVIALSLGALVLPMTGVWGGAIGVAAMASFNAAAAGAINGLWAAMLTARGMTLRAPPTERALMARSMPIRSPEITTWPGQLSLATWATPPSRVASMQISATVSSSRPRIAAIMPGAT